jgi:hypothetical protein
MLAVSKIVQASFHQFLLNCFSERIPRRFCLTAVLRGLQGASNSLATDIGGGLR